MKRLMDLFAALVAIGPAAVVVAVAAAFVRADTPGPAIFRQVRVGRHRKPFTMLKLRTMRIDTPSVASEMVEPQAITRVGAFLRRTKIDELPQIWSVLVGDMSFVGPRPCLPSQVELIEARERLGVFSARPGITGAAQLRGIDMSTPQALAQADADYLAARSLAKDVGLIAATVMGRGGGDAATRTNG